MRAVGLIVFFSLFFSSLISIDDWGFYAHKSINKYAVYTLPQELLALYKPHIHFVSEHAVDPDKRRFALKNEAYRHYIDIDHWGEPSEVPREIKSAIREYGQAYCLDESNDTTYVSLGFAIYDTLYDNQLHLERFATEIDIIIEGGKNCKFANKLVEYGVLPYFLEHHYDNLVRAFSNKGLSAILKLSADMGHYLGDAHVPLHTTENYNGQLSDQLGIHGFWKAGYQNCLQRMSMIFW